MLVLLPGSRVTPESIQLLTELTVYYAYMARSRLCTQLPMVLGPCCPAEVKAHIGDRMERVGIHFIAIFKDFLEQPFHALEATSCRIEPDMILLTDANGRERMCPLTQPSLLLEGRYDIDSHHRKTALRAESDRLMEAVLHPTPSPSADAGLRQVLFIYPRGSDHPVELVDSRLDYSFLGDAKALTTAENFRNLIGLLSDTFASPIGREMVHHSYALESITDDDSDMESGTGPRDARKKRRRRRSNRSAVRLMSRLLYCQWMRQSGWAGRVFPDRP